jgi:hypothetical protein
MNGSEGDTAERYAIACFRVVTRAINELPPPTLVAEQRTAAEIAALMGVAAHKAIRQYRDATAATFALSAYDVFTTAREALGA